MKPWVKQMVTTDNGKLSNTKVWSFIACGVSTWIMIHLELSGKMSWEFLMAYLGTVGGFSQVSKWMAYKYAPQAASSETTTYTATTSEQTQPEECDRPKKDHKSRESKPDEGSD